MSTHKKLTSRQKFTKNELEQRKKRAAAAEALMWERYGSLEPTEKQCEAQGKSHRAATIDRRGRLRRPACVKQSGLSVTRKPSTVRIVVKQGTLAPWRASLPPNERHRALVVAVERLANQKEIDEYDAALSVARKLNALYIYRKNNTNPAVVDTCNKVLDDEAWLRTHYNMAPLDRQRRECPQPASGNVNQAIKDELKRQQQQQKQQKQQKQRQTKAAGKKAVGKKAVGKKAIGKKAVGKALSWNEFRAANKGKGYSQAQLSAMYHRQ